MENQPARRLGPRRVALDGPCPFLSCLADGPHEHEVCAACDTIRHGNLDCPACRAHLLVPGPLGLYEARLAALYGALVDLWDAHPEHQLDEDGLQVCGGSMPTTRCDPLNGQVGDLMDEAFPEDVGDVAALLADTPDAWWWGSRGSGYGELFRDVAAEFRCDAEERLFGLLGCSLERPVDPATTRPVRACRHEPMSEEASDGR